MSLKSSSVVNSRHSFGEINKRSNVRNKNQIELKARNGKQIKNNPGPSDSYSSARFGMTMQERKDIADM